MKKFCPKCGKDVQKGTFCKDCQESDLHFKELRIKLCPSKRYFLRGKWTKFKDMLSLSEKLAKESIGEKVNVLEPLNPELLLKTGLKKKEKIIIEFQSEPYELPIEIEVTYSPGISKLGSTYFEGILQLRNATEEVKDYIKNFIKKNAGKKMFVNKVAQKGDSADFYFVNKRHINVVAQKVIRNFGGYMVPNAQLFSHNKQTSKDLYRLNTLVVVAPFTKGDVVIVEEKPIWISKMGKEISGTDLQKGKHFTFSFNEKNADSIKKIMKHKTQVVADNPEFLVLNPETYQEEPVKNPLNVVLQLGKKINVVNFKKRIYVVK